MNIDDETVMTTLQNMLDRYGDDALFEVERRVDELRLSGNDEALSLWLAVRQALFRKLGLPEPGPQHPLH